MSKLIASHVLACLQYGRWYCHLFSICFLTIYTGNNPFWKALILLTTAEAALQPPVIYPC